jgi:hypothetical protein
MRVAVVSRRRRRRRERGIHVSEVSRPRAGQAAARAE